MRVKQGERPSGNRTGNRKKPWCVCGGIPQSDEDENIVTDTISQKYEK